MNNQKLNFKIIQAQNFKQTMQIKQSQFDLILWKLLFWEIEWIEDFHFLFKSYRKF